MDDDVGVVGNDDHLATQLRLLQLTHEKIIDQGVVEVILRLVEDNRLATMSENEGQKGGRLLSR